MTSSMPTPVPTGSPIGSFKDEQGRTVPIQLHPHFNAWMNSVQTALTPGSGATTARPVNSAAFPLRVGTSFFDTTLGVLVTVKSLNPTVWVNGAGTPV